MQAWLKAKLTDPMPRTHFYFITATLWLCSIQSFAQQAPQTPEQTPATPVVCPAVAKPPTSTEVQEATAKARDHGLLWRLRKDGRDLYLFGTMHVGKLDWIFPGPQLSKALRVSDAVALELDLQEPSVQKAFKTAMDDMAPLRVDAALQARLDRQADIACLPREALAATPPLFQALSYLLLAARDAGLDQGYAQEHMLTAFAKKAGKPIISLETPAIQIRAVAGTGANAGQKLLEETLAELEQHKVVPLMLRLADAWANNRLDLLESYEEWCECINSEEDRIQLHRIIFDRNPHLADRITAEHAAGKQVFAAVGTLHMIGQQGLPKLLASRGFDVELLVGQR
ncbi:MAG: TraB/GumN family protein [Pseudomonadota bacterium]